MRPPPTTMPEIEKRLVEMATKWQRRKRIAVRSLKATGIIFGPPGFIFGLIMLSQAYPGHMKRVGLAVILLMLAATLFLLFATLWFKVYKWLERGEDCEH